MSTLQTEFPTNRTIDFQFKGDREYIHGTDIYTSIVDALAPTVQSPASEILSGFRLAIRKPSHQQCRLDVFAKHSANPRPETAVVEFQFSCGEHDFYGWLSETGQIVSERYLFTESEITAACTVGQDTVTLKSLTSYTAIENVVAATKHLHLTHYPDAEGKWFFSRLELSHLLPSLQGRNLSISLDQCVGKRLTRSDVKIDNEFAGRIYFSLVSV